MAWNQPSGGKNDNPWGRRPGQGSNLDERLKGWTRRLESLFRGGDAGGGGSSAGALLPLLLVGGLVAFWLLSAVYPVGAAERAVVQRFGAFAGVRGAGLHMHWPWPIETVTKVNVEYNNSTDFKSRVLTSDVNLVDLHFAVQYQFTDPVKKLFQVNDPEETLNEVSESAIREIIGRSTLDEVMVGTTRPDITRRARELIQRTLDGYNTGITISAVNLEDVTVPEAVIPARSDANKAEADKERYILESEAYANSILPVAQGTAARTQQDAQAYKAQVVAIAQGQTSRYAQLESAYAQAPEVTRRRMYMDTIETVLGRAHKVLIDGKSGGNMIYLPIDKLLDKSNAAPGGEQVNAEPAVSGAPREPQEQVTVEARARGER
jgi:membrane protease subunit HflK